MICYIIKDKRCNKYKRKTHYWCDEKWIEQKDKAQLFRTKGAATISCYSYSINLDSCKIGAKIILPDWVEIIPVEVNL